MCAATMPSCVDVLLQVVERRRVCIRRQPLTTCSSPATQLAMSCETPRHPHLSGGVSHRPTRSTLRPLHPVQPPASNPTNTDTTRLGCEPTHRVRAHTHSPKHKGAPLHREDLHTPPTRPHCDLGGQHLGISLWVPAEPSHSTGKAAPTKIQQRGRVLWSVLSKQSKDP